jgi:hypothetical protein
MLGRYIQVFRFIAFRFLRFQLCVLLLERIRNILQENQTEDNVLVFGGVHAAAQRVRHLPKLGFIADVRAVICFLLILLVCLRHSAPRGSNFCGF